MPAGRRLLALAWVALCVLSAGCGKPWAIPWSPGGPPPLCFILRWDRDLRFLLGGSPGGIVGDEIAVLAESPGQPSLETLTSLGVRLRSVERLVITNESDDDGLSCPSDVTGDRETDVQDLLALLGAWGETGVPEDIDGSGTVDVGDLLILLAAWGPCS